MRGRGTWQGEKAWLSWEGGIDVGKALPSLRPGPCLDPRFRHRPHSLPPLTFALRSGAIETAMLDSSASRQQLREKGAAAGGGAGVEEEPGRGRGLAWKAGSAVQGPEKGTALGFRAPHPSTIEMAEGEAVPSPWTSGGPASSRCGNALW